MTAKLDWDYVDDLDCEVATINPTLRVRAVHDDSPANPFTDWDGHWPMLTYSDRSLTKYDKVPGVAPDRPLSRFTPALFVFCQKELATILGVDPNSELDADDQRKWHTDADMLESFFADSLDGGYYESQKLEIYEQLYALLGIPCLRTTSTGYSQGDWAEVLVVATPEAQKEFGTDLDAVRMDILADPEIRNYVTDESRDAFIKRRTAKWWEKQLESQVDLYSAWAWGDVYGYVVEEAIRLSDGSEDDLEWEEIDDGSCWGYYGAEHDESGLEDAAMEAVEAHLSRVRGSAHNGAQETT